MRRNLPIAALMMAVWFAGSGAHAQSARPNLAPTGRAPDTARQAGQAAGDAPSAGAGTLRRSTSRQGLDEAWWTGSMLAPSAATLPRGHIAIESYLYDVALNGRYDGHGDRQPAPRADSFGSLTYMMYGLADRVMVGFVPTAGFKTVSDGPSSSGIGLGDVTLHAQYRLTAFHEHGRMPTTSVVVQEAFPTGKYDRLGDRPSDGLGSGAHTTTLGLFSQMYFWLPTGRILRMRLDLSRAFPTGVEVDGRSVYGTRAGFHGTAHPGGSFSADLSSEYSLTRRLVIALDIAYGHSGNTRVTGTRAVRATGQDPAQILLNSGPSESYSFAPAIEYSWNGNVGLLLGARVMTGGRNTGFTITPAVAINFVH